MQSQAIGLSLAQGRLEKIMYSHLKARFDFEPEFDTSLSSFDEQEDHIVVHMERKASVSADATQETAQVGYIIGADGGRSSVRKKLGLPFEGVTLPGVMLYGDVQAEGVDPDIWHVWGDASSLL
jgi:2-polyprenyl-6-methoxyphenol hydroxylase-like FAD-dependent oxidoreductase